MKITTNGPTDGGSGRKEAGRPASLAVEDRADDMNLSPLMADV